MVLAILRVEDVSARLAAQVPELAGNLGNAGQFAQIIERKQLPQWRLGAFVLPGALAGGAVGAMVGAFTQSIGEQVSVVLVVSVQGDPTGARAFDELTPIIRKVVEAICGWGPVGAPGVFALAHGELVGSQDGALIYQIDFTLSDQLRIT